MEIYPLRLHVTVAGSDIVFTMYASRRASSSAVVYRALQLFLRISASGDLPSDDEMYIHAVGAGSTGMELLALALTLTLTLVRHSQGETHLCYSTRFPVCQWCSM